MVMDGMATSRRVSWGRSMILFHFVCLPATPGALMYDDDKRRFRKQFNSDNVRWRLVAFGRNFVVVKPKIEALVTGLIQAVSLVVAGNGLVMATRMTIWWLTFGSFPLAIPWFLIRIDLFYFTSEKITYWVTKQIIYGLRTDLGSWLS